MLGLILLLAASVFVCHCPTTAWASPLLPPEGGDIVLSEFEDLPILVPDVGNIDSANLKEAGAEKFLDLWHIFVLSRKVVVSDEPWTLLVPLNEGLPKDPSFLTDKEYTREILLNHVTLGDIIQTDSAVSGGPPYYSLADSELIFTMEGASTFVNGIRLTGDHIRIGNGIVYVIEKTIPLSQPEFLQFVPLIEGELSTNPLKGNLLNLVERNGDNVQTSKTDVGNPLVVEGVFDASTDSPQPSDEPSTAGPSTSTISEPPKPDSKPPKPASRPTRFEKFRNRVTQNDRSTRNNSSVRPTKAPTTTAREQTTTAATPAAAGDKILLEDLMVTPEKKGVIQGSADDNHFIEFTEEEKKARPSKTTFLNSLLDELGTVNAIGAEFAHHFVDAELGQFLSPDKNYTAIIPTNDAFYDYYPIDWGFNPFLVKNFTKDVLLNHILEGDIHLQEFNDAVEIQTIEGRTIKVSKNGEGTLLVNGHIMPKETEVELPNGRLYYIHQLLFVDYNRVNALREEYPFLETAPLLSFPWISSPFLSHLLNRLQENPNTKLFAHLLRNSDIAHRVSSSDENLNRLSYSAFVPTDEALKKSFHVENLAVLEREAINDFLLEHIVPGYLFEEDFEDGFNLLSLTNKAIPIRIQNGDIFIGPAKVLRPQKFVYNLGAIFIIDKPFMEIPTNEPMTILAEKLRDDMAVIPLENTPKSESKPKTKIPEETLTTTQSPSSGGAKEGGPVPATTQPEITYEVRTEISFSRQINDGIIMPVSRDVIEKAKAL